GPVQQLEEELILADEVQQVHPVVGSEAKLGSELGVHAIHYRRQLLDQLRRQDVLDHKVSIALELLASRLREAILQATRIHGHAPCHDSSRPSLLASMLGTCRPISSAYLGTTAARRS